MAALEEDQFGTNLDYLFTKKQKYINKFRSYVRCDECDYSKHRDDLDKKHLYCTYYHMICMNDCTCKAGKKK